MRKRDYPAHDPWRETNMGEAVVERWKSWRVAMVSLITGIHPEDRSRWLTRDERCVMLEDLKKWYKHAAFVTTTHKHWMEIETKTSLRDTKELLEGNNPPPFTMLPWSKANQYRLQLVAGWRGVLPWQLYDSLQRGRTQTTDEETGLEQESQEDRQCPLCHQEALSVPHVMRDCKAVEKERVTTWKAVAEAIRVAHTSDLARGKPGGDRPEVITIPTLAFEDNLDLEQRHALYRFMMGAEVSDEFMGLGLEGWHTRAWKGGHTSMNIKMDVYTAAARVAGRFIVRTVDLVQRETELQRVARGPATRGQQRQGGST